MLQHRCAVSATGASDSSSPPIAIAARRAERWPLERLHALRDERVRALVRGQINQLCGFTHAEQRRFRDGLRLSGQRDHAAVVVPRSSTPLFSTP